VSKQNSVTFTGNIVGEVKPAQTSGGKPVTYARLAVDLLGPENVKTGTLWLGIAAYGTGAAQLARHARGERVSIEGKLDAPSVYRDASEQPQVGLRVVTFAITAAPLPAKPTALMPTGEQTAAVAEATALVTAGQNSDVADDLLAEFEALADEMAAAQPAPVAAQATTAPAKRKRAAKAA